MPNVCYELTNTMVDCINYWRRIIATKVQLTTIDPKREYRLCLRDYYQYLEWAQSYITPEEDYL